MKNEDAQKILCALCQEDKPLRNSHAIPNSIFKKILKKNHGKAISFKSDSHSKIIQSSDSWAKEQLCYDCEQHLANNYETYSIGAFRGQGIKITKESASTLLSGVNTKIIQLYILSIIWRASLSDHPAYASTHLDKGKTELLRNALLKKQHLPSLDFTIKISKLIDTSHSNGFSSKNLKDMIFSPFSRYPPQSKHHSICLVFEGFFIETYTPGLLLKQRREKGFLNTKTKLIEIPHIEILSIPEILSSLHSGLQKHHNGLTNIR
ncbi:hypothetical protein [Chromobacterium sp. IRSSSOUMB001]|uniref:hypothetical protein n=1 Tax=Chromobacterium sp. IRSSSOUMB001 TaxID=2927123 RepID=UPI0020BF1EA2|nr:hypothetical protein [Chromobacterium sp. IRSSSOUMB001]